MSELLDKWTKIDDILRDNSKLLNKLINEQIKTNQYLVALLNKKFVDIDLALPESIGGEIIKNLNYLYKTITHKWTNQVVASSDKLTILKGNYTGIVSEVMIRTSDAAAANKNYSFRILADNEIIYDDTWDNFNTENGLMSDMSAFDNGTWYVLAFNTIAFTNAIEIEIYNLSNSITFSKVFIKYHRRIT